MPRPSRSRLARSRGRADFRNHGAAHGRSRRRPAGDPLLDRGTFVAAERNGPDVFADERLPFAALAGADLEPTKRRPPGPDPVAFGPSRPINPNEKRLTSWPEIDCQRVRSRLRRGIRLLSLARFSVVGPEGSRTDPSASAWDWFQTLRSIRRD
jgi:hypothetical protein